jgi:hypothetical protein
MLFFKNKNISSSSSLKIKVDDKKKSSSNSLKIKVDDKKKSSSNSLKIKVDDKKKSPNPKKIIPIANDCPDGQIRNPKTKRCVSKKGKIGLEILKNIKVDDKKNHQLQKKLFL